MVNFSYLFIMCLNFLILKFIEGHHNKTFDGFQTNKHTPPIPILCFTDDCIIFCKANNKSIQFITQTFQLFANEPGLNICWNKTKILFSKNTPSHKIREICNLLQVKHENTQEKYLGLPLKMQTYPRIPSLISSQTPKQKFRIGIQEYIHMRVDRYTLIIMW